MISNNVQYLYSLDGRLAAKRVNNEDDLLYGEKAEIKQGYVDVCSSEDYISTIGGLDGTWAFVGGGNIDLRTSNPEFKTIEDLTIEEVMALYNGLYSSDSNSHIPTSELQKWFEAHGVTDAKINNNAKDEYGRSSQSVTFTYEGKSYEWNQVSYEVSNSYYYLNGVTDREDVDGFGHTVHVNNAQELRSALLKYADDKDYMIIIDRDIDMSGIEWEPIPKLCATILGGEHTISNLTIKGDGQYVGLFEEIDSYAQVKDLTFDKATVTNARTESDTYTGVLAGKISNSQCSQVRVINSTVTGGGCAGMIVGTTDSYVSFDKCSVDNCTVSGDYATGGAIGYAKNTNFRGIYVSNITVNGGQWAGGIAGSADYDNKYNYGYYSGPELQCGDISNVTINGGYHGKMTLGAGGIAGRVGTTNTKETTVWCDSRTVGQGYSNNVTINNAYAEGIMAGWFCMLDEETGQVIKNCNSSLGGNVDGRPLVGKSGIDEHSTITSYSGNQFNFLTDRIAILEEFARQNNLIPVENMAGTCYKDTNGVYYYLTFTMNGIIGCSDFYNSIDAYKELVADEVSGPDAAGHRGIIVPITNSNGETKYWDLDPWQYMSLRSGNLLSEEMYLLANLGAQEVYVKEGGLVESDGTERGVRTFEEIYYKTADGKWHKLTTSNRGEYGALCNPLKYLDDGTLTSCDPKFDIGTFTFEDYLKAFCGTPETISLRSDWDQNYGLNAPWFCIEDLTYEEVYEQMSGNLPLQPPYNSGYNDDLEDGFVITQQEALTGLEGIDLDPHPENATFEDYKAMLVIINFLKAQFSDVGGISTASQSNVAFNSPEEMYDTWSRLPGGIELTKDNFEQYKHMITLLDKEQAIAKVMEKLQEYSARLQGITQDSNGNNVLREWLSDLLDAIGAKNVNIISEGNDAGGTTFSFAYVRPAYISFDLNGSHHEVGICPANKGMAPPQSAIVSAEEVEDLRNYMPEDEYLRVLNYYFTPVYTVDGKVQTYMFSWTADITGFKLKFGDSPKGVLYKYINGSPLAFDTMWRGDGSREPFTCTGFQELVEWVKTHDVAAACQKYDALRTIYEDTTNGVLDQYRISQEVLDLGLAQEVLDWYFEGNGDMSFRKDPDVEFPVFKNVPELIAYAKSHDLNAEFAACMEKKNAIEAERAAQEVSSSTDDTGAKERQTYVNLRYSELKAELQENSIAINYLAWNYSLYADKYIKGSITKEEFETEILRILEEAKAKITNPGKNDSINEERGYTSEPPEDDGDKENYEPSYAPYFEPQNEDEAKIVEDAAKEYDKANLLQEFLEKYEEDLSEYPKAVDKFKAQVSVIIDRYINLEITKSELDELVEIAFNEVLAEAKNSEVPPADEPETPPTPQKAPTRITHPQTPLRNVGRRAIPGVEIQKIDKNKIIYDDVKVDTPTEPEVTEEPKETEPEVLMTSEDYKQEAKDNVDELQKKVGNVIYENGIYYNTFNNKRYNYVWDPYEHKWLTFDPSDMTNGKANDSTNKTLMRIQRILAVLRQGLVFTANPDVCKDKDGNYYDYDESSGIFVKRN